MEEIKNETTDTVNQETNTEPATQGSEPIAEDEAELTSGKTTEEDTGARDEGYYARLAREDMMELITLFPHLAGKESVAELDDPLRYAALRDLGLTPKEAYLATGGKDKSYDNRSHLKSSVPRRAGASSDLLSARELECARELFSGLSDREIQNLYKKVTK